jgi:hypothetical protein
LIYFSAPHRAIGEFVELIEFDEFKALKGNSHHLAIAGSGKTMGQDLWQVLGKGGACVRKQRTVMAAEG